MDTSGKQLGLPVDRIHTSGKQLGLPAAHFRLLTCTFGKQVVLPVHFLMGVGKEIRIVLNYCIKGRKFPSMEKSQHLSTKYMLQVKFAWLSAIKHHSANCKRIAVSCTELFVRTGAKHDSLTHSRVSMSSYNSLSFVAASVINTST